MRCDDVLERLELLADGALAADEVDDVRAHLDGCPACAVMKERGEALGRAIAVLGAPALPPAPREAPAPAPPLRGRAAPPRPPRERRLRTLLAGVAAGVALTLVTLGGIAAAAGWRDAGERRAALAAVEDVVDRLLARGVSAAEVGERTVDVTIGGRRAVVVLRVSGGPDLYEVHAQIHDPPALASRGVEVAALCGPSAIAAIEGRTEDRR